MQPREEKYLQNDKGAELLILPAGGSIFAGLLNGKSM